MINFKLFGIRTQVQPFFLLIMAYLGGGYNLLHNASTDNFLKVLVFMGAGFISILVHELGHALMMKKYGRQPHIVLHGMGGAAISSGFPLSKGQDILVSLMGPIAQFILGLIVWFISQNVEFPTVLSQKFCQDLYLVSVFWAVINLIPIFPLDGGQILAAIVGPKRRKIVNVLGIVIGGGLIAFLVMNNSASMWNLLIIGLLIWDNVKALQR